MRVDAAPESGLASDARALVAPFARALGGAQKWAAAGASRVDDEWAASQECAARLGAFVDARWPQLLAQLRRAPNSGDGGGLAHEAERASFSLSGGTSISSSSGSSVSTSSASAARRWGAAREPPPWHRYTGSGNEADADEERAQENGAAAEDAARRAAVVAFVARAQLQARLPPPAAALAALFDSAPPGAPGCAVEYSSADLEAIVRTLLVLGRAPAEPWLSALAGAVRARRAHMETRALRGFLEGLRFFRTKSSSRELRDAISVLSEWV